MDSYTDICDNYIDDIHPYDDNYEEKLMKAAQRFRPFDVALDPFLLEHGFEGDITDSALKIRFIKNKFESADMIPPREIDKWYEEHQDIRRKTAFMLCFAFGLGVGETDDFFRRVFCRERCFDCHSVDEVVYYYCMRNGLTFDEAEQIIAKVPSASPGKIVKKNVEILYTGTIMKEIESMIDVKDVIQFLTDNNEQFAYNNVTAYEYINRLWDELASADGLLNHETRMVREFGNTEGIKKKTNAKTVRPLDALMALLGMDKKSLSELSKDGRTLIPILKRLPKATRDSFPDMQGIGQIQRGEHVSYERVRKWMILLAFSEFWIRLAVERKNYLAGNEDREACVNWINNCLLDTGYMELYSGNPYDWIFLFSIHDELPMLTFRGIWNIMIADAQDRVNALINTD